MVNENLVGSRNERPAIINTARGSSFPIASVLLASAARRTPRMFTSASSVPAESAGRIIEVQQRPHAGHMIEGLVIEGKVFGIDFVAYVRTRPFAQ